jgi:hypothetical protein
MLGSCSCLIYICIEINLVKLIRVTQGRALNFLFCSYFVVLLLGVMHIRYGCVSETWVYICNLWGWFGVNPSSLTHKKPAM